MPESPSRPYRSTLRQEQARQTRERILDASAEVFSARGYSGASLAEIAAAAGVSVESVKVHGPKRALLLAAFERAFAGEAGEASLADRPEIARIAALEDPEEMLAQLVPVIATANARTGALWAAFTAAARDDAEVGAVLAGLLERRHDDYGRTVDLLAQKGMGGVRDLDASGRRSLADALSFLMSPEGHQQLVVESGWTFERYDAWLLSTVRTTVTATSAVSTG